VAYSENDAATASPLCYLFLSFLCASVSLW